MAILKTFNGNGNYRNENAMELVTEYIFNPYKTISGYYGGYGVSSQCPAESMMIVSEQFGKSKGVQLRHYVLSFAPCELTNPIVANEIGGRIAQFIGREYQAMYAVHENREHLHIHIVSNSVSYIDGHRFYGRRKEFYKLMDGMQKILCDYGIYRLIYDSQKENIPSAEQHTG